MPNTVRVLIADDSKFFAHFLKNVLIHIEGIEVVGSAADGKQCLKMIKDLKPDIVSLDIEMPEMNGHEVLQELKSCPSPPKVVVVSSVSTSAISGATHALSNGAFDYLPKPDTSSFQTSKHEIETHFKRIVSGFRESVTLNKSELIGTKKEYCALPTPQKNGSLKPKDYERPPRKIDFATLFT